MVRGAPFFAVLPSLDVPIIVGFHQPGNFQEVKCVRMCMSGSAAMRPVGPFDGQRTRLARFFDESRLQSPRPWA
jgi:hypothetical protein